MRTRSGISMKSETLGNSKGFTESVKTEAPTNRKDSGASMSTRTFNSSTDSGEGNITVSPLWIASYAVMGLMLFSMLMVVIWGLKMLLLVAIYLYALI